MKPNMAEYLSYRSCHGKTANTVNIFGWSKLIKVDQSYLKVDPY